MPLVDVSLPVSHLPQSTSFFLSALQPLGYRYLGQRGGTQQIGFGVDEPDFYLYQERQGYDIISFPSLFVSSWAAIVLLQFRCYVRLILFLAVISTQSKMIQNDIHKSDAEVKQARPKSHSAALHALPSTISTPLLCARGPSRSPFRVSVPTTYRPNTAPPCSTSTAIQCGWCVETTIKSTTIWTIVEVWHPLDEWAVVAAAPLIKVEC